MSSQTGHSVPSSRSCNTPEQASAPGAFASWLEARTDTYKAHDIERPRGPSEIRDTKIFRESPINSSYVKRK